MLLAIGLAAAVAAGPLRACEVGETTVAEVYPTAAALPENMLRFYIYFSAPMGLDDILPAIDLLDAEGRVLEGVFLSNRYDLWSADRTRLTLLFDPGRVKTGLAANNELGRALVAGETYQLSITVAAEDMEGCPLASAHRVTFEATEADVLSPSPEHWTLFAPSVGTRQPLTLYLDGPVDHLSLAYRLRVIGPDGAPVAGRIDLDEAETQWHFTPRAEWSAATYHVAIDPQLEDLAGNRPGVLFDQPTDAPVIDWLPTLTWSPAPS
ncbi:MAG: hypothetical protein AAFQ79_07675 [Pseudomonadota bacterium]